MLWKIIQIIQNALKIQYTSLFPKYMNFQGHFPQAFIHEHSTLWVKMDHWYIGCEMHPTVLKYRPAVGFCG